MFTITRQHGHINGVSDDGRFHYQSNSIGDFRIDGRWALQGFYINSQGGIDQNAPVEAADWQIARDLMNAVERERIRLAEVGYQESLERLRARDAALEGIEQIRGGAYDSNTW